MIFNTSFHPLEVKNPEAGQVRTLPWDNEIFGFPVGEYNATDSSYFCRYPDRVSNALDLWAAKESVRLVSCELDAGDFERMRHIQECGFRYVDTSLKATAYNLMALRIPPVKLPVRLAHMSERDAIAEIAYRSFRFGRYHQDPVFPFHLACERYRRWIHKAMDTFKKDENSDTDERIYVFTIQEAVAGFLHLVIKGVEADLRLGGIDKKYQGSIYGVGLFCQVFNKLREEGIKKLSAKISAVNLDIVNMYGAMGFKFADAVAIFHRHYMI